MKRDEAPDAPVTLKTGDLAQMAANERVQVESKGLFYVAERAGTHTFRNEIEALERGEPTISGTAKELSKFFGIYKQQGRGARGKKTDDYFFMVRIKLPAGGRLTPAQWGALDEAADRFGDGTLRITSRQGIQYHHVYGPGLAPLIRHLNPRLPPRKRTHSPPASGPALPPRIRHLNRRYREEATLGACGDVSRNVMTS